MAVMLRVGMQHRRFVSLSPALPDTKRENEENEKSLSSC
ncbi:Uncharacterized protein dnm_049260 [Desulfonema magnum]|uniref:Uncharacterized protein n=1 Tax=Desulfonema magnum TaxID=45655 RepID=A0A975BNC8_9BACT|nr:Uncharacterized protein dnm_049260 [Desulfonema magnum]